MLKFDPGAPVGGISHNANSRNGIPSIADQAHELEISAPLTTCVELEAGSFTQYRTDSISAMVYEGRIYEAR
jgi:hypothetical protein